MAKKDPRRWPDPAYFDCDNQRWITCFSTTVGEQQYYVAAREDDIRANKAKKQPLSMYVFIRHEANPFSFGLIGDLPRNVEPRFTLVHDAAVVEEVVRRVEKENGTTFTRNAPPSDAPAPTP